MRNPKGYAVVTNVDGRVREFDTYTCAHCQRVTHVMAGQKPEDLGGLCRHCMGLVCSQCVDAPCVPAEEMIRAIERRWEREEMLRSLGITG